MKILIFEAHKLSNHASEASERCANAQCSKCFAPWPGRGPRRSALYLNIACEDIETKDRPLHTHQVRQALADSFVLNCSVCFFSVRLSAFSCVAFYLKAGLPCCLVPWLCGLNVLTIFSSARFWRGNQVDGLPRPFTYFYFGFYQSFAIFYRLFTKRIYT